MSEVSKPERFMELEGLRGVAAVAVVIYHNLLAFYPLAFLGFHSIFSVGQNMKYEDNLYGNPVMVFLSGSFAVVLFFILSGFVLSIGFFKTDNIDIVKKLATKRYLRLMLPALASILIAYVLLSAGLSHAQKAAALTHSGWLHDGWNFTPNILGAIGDGLYGIFVQAGNMYNGPLWTMTTEFLGSFMVFAFLVLFAKVKYRAVFYGVLMIAVVNTWFMAFVVGMILADLVASGKLRKAKRSWKIIPFLALGLFLGGYPLQGASGTVYKSIEFLSIPINWDMLYLTIGGTLVISCILMSTQLAALFKKKYISGLGKYTFSLYLIHSSILYTFTTFAFLGLRQHIGLGFNTSVLLALVLSVPLVIAATYVFEKYIDAPSIKVSTYTANILLGYKEIPRGLLRARKTVMHPMRRVAKLLRKKATRPVIQEGLD